MLIRFFFFLRYTLLALAFLLCPLNIVKGVGFADHCATGFSDSSGSQWVVLLFSILFLCEWRRLKILEHRSNGAALRRLGQEIWLSIFKKHPILAILQKGFLAYSCLAMLLIALAGALLFKERSCLAVAYLASRAERIELAERIYAWGCDRSESSSLAALRLKVDTTTPLNDNQSTKAIASVYGQNSIEMADYLLTLARRHEMENESAASLYFKAGKLYQRNGDNLGALLALAYCANSNLELDQRYSTQLIREAAQLSKTVKVTLDCAYLQRLSIDLHDRDSASIFKQLTDLIFLETNKHYEHAALIALLSAIWPFAVCGLGNASVKELILWHRSRSLENRYRALTEATSQTKGNKNGNSPAQALCDSKELHQAKSLQLIEVLNDQINLALYRRNHRLAEEKSRLLLQASASGAVHFEVDEDTVMELGRRNQESWELRRSAEIISLEGGCLFLITLVVVLCAF